MEDAAAYEAEVTLKLNEQWVEYPLLPGDSLPSEAVELVNLTVPAAETVIVNEINWQTGVIEAVEKQVLSDTPVETGEQVYQLVDGWKFEDGKLYQRIDAPLMTTTGSGAMQALGSGVEHGAKMTRSGTSAKSTTGTAPTQFQLPDNVRIRLP